MNKIFKVLALVLMLAGLVALPAFADGTVTLAGGSLSLANPHTVVDFGNVPFSLAPQVAGPVAMTPAFRVSDFRLGTAGWNVMLSAAPFTDGSHPFSSLEVRPAAAVMVPGGTDTMPPGILSPFVVGTWSAVNGTPVKYANKGTAAGQYSEWDFPNDWRITVPAASFPGVYTSVWTITLASGT